LGPGTQPQLQDQFADPAKVPVALGIQNNTFLITHEKAREIEVMRKELLPEVNARLGLTDGEAE